jgi:hypothetical protein
MVDGHSVTADDDPRPGPPGRALSGRAGPLVGVLIGLVLVLLAGAALAVGGPGGPGPASEHPESGIDHDHVESDPATGAPVTDPCRARPEMCGEGVGTGGPCDDPGMCGPIEPGPVEEEIDADSGSCVGELCGEIGPGVDDGTAA